MKSIWKCGAVGISAIALASVCGCAGDSGSEGAAGQDGASALLNIREISPGETCEAGGSRVESGLDLDGDGNLAANEVTASSNICNGTSGTDGEDGTNGVDGMNGVDGTDGDSLDPCAGATPLEITSIEGVEATYFSGFDSAPITINTTSTDPVEVSFVTNALTFRPGANSGEYLFTPDLIGEDFRVVAVATDGCTLDTESFVIANVERPVADVRFVHLYDGLGGVEVTEVGQVNSLALLGFEDSFDVNEVTAGTYSYDFRDLDSGAIVATTPAFTLDPGTSNTILMYRNLGIIAFTKIVDDVTPAAPSDMRLRVFHGADGLDPLDALIDATGAYGPLVEDVDPNTSSIALNTNAPDAPVLIGLDTDGDSTVDLNFQSPELEGGDIVNVFAYLDDSRPKLYFQFISNPTTIEDTSSFSYNGTIEIGPGDELVPTPGATLTLSGALATTDPTWTRPGASCGSGSGSSFYFDAIPITNATLAPQTITLTADWSSYDGYLHLFANEPDPNAPRNGCLTGNDDFNGQDASRINSFDIAPGQRVWVVASTYGSDDTGAWTVDITTQ